MKCLVAGGAGFIGSNLTYELLAKGHAVTIIDDLSGGSLKNMSSFNQNPNFSFHKGSITSDMHELFHLGKFDVVFHLAALPRVPFSIEHPIETHEANVNGTLNLLEHCRKHRVKRFVFSSSGSVYGDQEILPYTEDMKPNPLSPYALHKLIGEQYCKQYSMHYGLQTIALRYFNVYGPRMDPQGSYALLIAKCLHNFIKGEPVTIYGDGEQTRDFTYVGDVVNANILAATTKNPEAYGSVFNAGAGNNQTVNHVVSTIKEIIGRGEIIRAPPRIEPRHAKADITRAKRILNWEPRTRFEEGIRIAAEDFMSVYGV